MKGRINLHEEWGWGVLNEANEWLPLHPDDLNLFAEMNERFDNFEARVLSAPEVEFRTITQHKFSGKILYAKLNPKEEPKQESPEEPTMIDDWLDEYGDPEIYKKVERELESREAARKYTEPKQETLEEVAERLYPILLEEDGWDKNKQYRDEWIEGAKWQAERMYSEEEVFRIIASLLHTPKLVEESSWEDITEWFEQFKKK